MKICKNLRLKVQNILVTRALSLFLSLSRICQVLIPLLSVKESAKMSGDAANEESGSNLPTIADDLVVTKYKMAAEITNSESEWLNLSDSGQFSTF